MPLKNADITAALSGGSAVKLSDGHSLYFVTNGRGAGSWVYEYRDAGRLRSKGLGLPTCRRPWRAGCGRTFGPIGATAPYRRSPARRLRLAKLLRPSLGSPSG